MYVENQHGIYPEFERMKESVHQSSNSLILSYYERPVYDFDFVPGCGLRLMDYTSGVKKLYFFSFLSGWVTVA